MLYLQETPVILDDGKLRQKLGRCTRRGTMTAFTGNARMDTQRNLIFCSEKEGRVT